jgi:hypothetical protein
MFTVCDWGNFRFDLISGHTGTVDMIMCRPRTQIQTIL